MSATLSPNDQVVVVPARQAYSHSASDGSRIPSFGAINLRLRSSFVTFSQNSTASAQVTISTELRGPCHFAGLLPITTQYNSCVTSYLAMAKGRLNVTLWAGLSLAGAFSSLLPIVN